jgi:hypothetical protein
VCNPRASWLQVNPRKTKEKGLDFLGFPWPNWDFSTGYGGKIKKILRQLNSLVRLHANAGPGRIPTASRTQRSADRHWYPQKDIAYVSGFVNEWDCDTNGTAA